MVDNELFIDLVRLALRMFDARRWRRLTSDMPPPVAGDNDVPY